MYKKIDLKIIGDHRGSLISIEGMRTVPFEIKRVYYIFGNIQDVRRGFHAHKKLTQLAVCVSGSCKFQLDDGTRKEIIELNNPDQGILITGLIWREMFDFSKDCVLMVFADCIYDENDYIRNYDDFLKELKI